MVDASRQKQRHPIIFDLDGTLYELRGGSYKRSLLRKRVVDNARKYVAAKLKCGESKARKVLANIQKLYGENVSIGLEKEFKINRYDYFDTVWNIPAKGIVKKEGGLGKTLSSLKTRYDLVLLSDAPRVWIDSVLAELRIKDIFCDNVFSGEGNNRKGLGTAFRNVTKALDIEPSSCIVVGDQEDTDIIPAVKLGMRAIFVHRTRRSKVADITIKSIMQLPAAIRELPDRRVIRN
ncbi:HAD family hydrolase [Patescibacteria group bacterium]|nr:HAD family hydrolase [Patescibacteria group bacterium]